MIDRLHNPTQAQIETYIESNTPVVLEGITSTWKANTAWDIPYLQSKIGEMNVQVVTGKSDCLYWDPKQGLAQRAETFDAFADRLPTEVSGGTRSYLQDDINAFPVLKEDYELPPTIARLPIKRTKLWISGAGMITPLHYDAVETLHWIVRGTKRFKCFAPGVASYYPHAWYTTAPFISKVDIDHPDYARFPRFRKAVPLEFELRAGEILYLPSFWWHHVSSVEGLNISVNFVWFAKPAKNLRFFPQFARCLRHLALRLHEVRAKAKQAASQPTTVSSIRAG